MDATATAPTGDVRPVEQRSLSLSRGRFLVGVAGGAALLWLGTRLGWAAYTYFVIAISSNYRSVGARRTWIEGGGLRSPFALVTAWGQWDYGWFARIAGHGYDAMSAAFFPMFPALMRVGDHLLQRLSLDQASALLVSGLIVANAAALVAFVALALLGASESGSVRTGLLAVVLLAAYPYAFFLTAPYSESLFLAAATVVLLGARRGLWWAVFPAAYVAGLTRSAGVILVLPILWEYARQRGWLRAGTWRGAWWRGWRRWGELGLGMVLVTPVPAAVATYMAYLWLRFHDPLAFVAALRSPVWGRHTVPPWETVRLYFAGLAQVPTLGFWQLLLTVEGVLLLVFVVGTVVAARYVPVSFTLYMAGLLALILVSPVVGHPDTLSGSERYLVGGVPLFVAAARLLDPRPSLTYTVLFVGVLLEGALAGFWLTGVFLA